MQKTKNSSTNNYCRPLVLLLFVACFLLSVNAASGFSEDANESVLSDSSMFQVTRSSHLIELDISHENVIFVQESIVFSINGDGYPDEMMINIPESAEIDVFRRVEMMGTNSTPINYTLDGNVLFFDDSERLKESSMPALYEIKYLLRDEGDISSRSFSKVLYGHDLPHYPLSRLSIVVSYPEGLHVHLTDDTGNAVQADSVATNENTVSFTWISPEIHVLNVNTHSPIEQSSVKGNYSAFIFLIVSALIVVVVYMLYSRRHEKADIRDLKDNYEALLAVILQLEEDHRNKVIAEKDFKSLHKKYKSQALEIKKRIDGLKKK